jgi:hypothetical protein
VRPEECEKLAPRTRAERLRGRQRARERRSLELGDVVLAKLAAHGVRVDAVNARAVEAEDLLLRLGGDWRVSVQACS